MTLSDYLIDCFDSIFDKSILVSGYQLTADSCIFTLKDGRELYFKYRDSDHWKIMAIDEYMDSIKFSIEEEVK